MAQNIGTLITSAIRPNDSLDPIASAYAVEVKGGHHTYATLAERDAIILERREWGMLCTIYNDGNPSNNKTYQLKYGVANTNITNVTLNNLNWVESNVSAGIEWLDSVISVNTTVPGSPSNGDRYLVGTKPSDTITGSPWDSYSPGFIAEWSSVSSTWIITNPTNGMSIRVDNDDNSIYRYEGVYTTGIWVVERTGQIRSIIASTGDGSNYTSTSEPDFLYSKDMIFLTTFTSTNATASVYIDINGLGNKQVKKPTAVGLSDFNANDLKLTIVYSLIYDGTYFQLTSPYSSSTLNNKYYIEPTEYTVVPLYHQYWIYGNLTIAGTLVNYGQVIVANGGVILSGSGSFVNNGALSLVSLGLGGGGTTSYYDTETIDISFQNTIYGPSVSAIVKHNSLTASHFNTNGGATSGYLLSTDVTGDLIWKEPTKLSVTDYNTGLSFSEVSNIIFRGGIVNVPGGTSSGELVTGSNPTVTVWIPSPDYADYFNPTINSASWSRYISTPSVNAYSSSPGDYGTYGVGTWSTLSDFNNNHTRRVKDTLSDHIAFSDTEFSCFDDTTTIDFYLYDDMGSTLSSITGYLLNSTNTTSTSGAITITTNSFLPDNDRYKADVTGTIDVATYFPNGGKFNWKVIHNNGYGPGANKDEIGTTVGSITTGVYEYTNVGSIFLDLGTSSGNITSVEFDEYSPNLVYLSGVAFYGTSSVFSFTASGINMLNDMTIPTTKQIDFICTNMAISDTHDGYADGSKPGIGATISGWTLDWNKSGLTYSRFGYVDMLSEYIPGFYWVQDNTINTSPISSVESNLYDYDITDTVSVSKLYLFDTYTASVNYSFQKKMDNEMARLSMSGFMISGTSSFDSNIVLPSDELQCIFGTVIFPQTDFTQFYPSVNTSASVDYSNLVGYPVKSFDVYTDTNIGITTTLSFSDYRWHVTSYGLDEFYLTSFGNALFGIDSNFNESYIDYNAVISASGSGDLVLLVGIDSSGLNETPDNFYYLTGDPSTYPGRQDPLTYNLDLNDKVLQWTAGSIPVYISKVWLVVGYKDSSDGKKLRMSGVKFSID